MTLPIEKRLQLLGDVSNLMLMGSIHVYGTKKPNISVTLNKKKSRTTSTQSRAA